MRLLAYPKAHDEDDEAQDHGGDRADGDLRCGVFLGILIYSVVCAQRVLVRAHLLRTTDNFVAHVFLSDANAMCDRSVLLGIGRIAICE